MSNSSLLPTIIKLELKTLAREKTFLLLLGLFLAMTFFALYIGWFTRTTTSAIYDATVAVLHRAGAVAIPANPILSIPPLAVFDNMIVYVLLVGALLSIVIGYRSFMRERKSGVISLVFVRPLSMGAYIAGKLLGILLALLVIMFATFLMSGLSAFLLPALHISGAEVLRLAGFYGVSFLYLSFFALLGFASAAYFLNESIALFAPIMVWVGAVFILPELATGQNPVALLNPITLSQASVNPNAFFAFMRTAIEPISIGQHYTYSAIGLLEAGSGVTTPLWSTMTHIGGALVGLIVSLFALVAVCVVVVRLYTFTTDPLI